jgi:arylformamidase
MKTYYDVSMSVTPDIQVWKNYEAKKPKFKVVADFSNSVVHETEVTLNLHTGTHMDFPLHMLKDGKTSDTLDLSKLIRTVKVFDLSHVTDAINDSDLVHLNIRRDDFVLFKTKNSFEEDFNFNFIFVNEWASKFLVEKGVAGVGVDGLGIERDQIGHPTHKQLMRSDILIIEGLRLKEVPEGSYQMYALPIKMKGTDALLLSVILEVI